MEGMEILFHMQAVKQHLDTFKRKHLYVKLRWNDVQYYVTHSIKNFSLFRLQKNYNSIGCCGGLHFAHNILLCGTLLNNAKRLCTVNHLTAHI
uniref:Uncharacterized protein n=1 Tax=Pyxicephalus adspersus TaxID=30357 RepID=A0AAV2ZTM4_PYXAD|nr:TPA: hypothetical protein GDO54_004320 [Pyxicephalus adspersus]